MFDTYSISNHNITTLILDIDSRVSTELLTLTRDWSYNYLLITVWQFFVVSDDN